MRFTAIPATEKAFRATEGNGRFNFSPVDVPVPGEDLRLKALFAKSLDTSGYFYAVEHQKKRVVIHYTAGHLGGDMNTLTQDNIEISVPFVIARDGTIYQLFPSKYWSGHLGKGIGNEGTKNAQDKCTIGIELSNYGYLVERQGNLETIYSRQKKSDGTIGPVDVYCSLAEEEAYLKLPDNKDFREQVYFATHTDAQYKSLIILLRYLTAAYGIDRKFLPESTRYVATDEVLDFDGIVSHVNYRPGGKWDIGPAFDWERVIAGVQAPTFEMLTERSATLVEESGTTTAAVQSEEELLALMPTPRDAALENESTEEDGLPIVEAPVNRQVYALLVGINDYQENLIVDGQVRFPVLNGCVNDVQKIEALLNNQVGIKPHIERLINEHATKAKIVRLFREHLSKAGPDDTALFYFSGHGTQEYADAAWDQETDGKLECLACYYDTANADFLLADKELRYLIHELWNSKKPHIVTLFDCCHSGDNTRAATLVEAVQADFPSKRPVERAIPYTFSQRDWNQFVFGGTISLAQLQEQKTAKTLPEGVHVQMAACEAHEPAVEMGSEGIFTKVLTDILHMTAGNITYGDLQSRVRAYLRNVYKQQPRFRVAGADGSSAMLYQTFLGGSEQQEAGLVGTILHSPAGWSLDKGSILGLGTDHKTVVAVSDDKLVRFRVVTIFPDFTTLEPADDSPNAPDTTVVYKTHITGLMAQKIRVAFELEDVSADERAHLMADVVESMKDHVTVVDKADEKPGQTTSDDLADYVVRGRKGQYYLTYPVRAADPDDSMAYRPLVMPIETTQEGALDVLASDLNHIARWEYIRQLANQNPQNQLQSDPLRIEIWQQKANKSEEKKTMNGQGIQLDCEEFKGTHADGTIETYWASPLRITITNTAPVDLYVCAVYLSMGFEAFPSLLPGNVHLLEAGKSIDLTYQDNPVMPLELEPIVPVYNWPERVIHFKFISSTSLFEAKDLTLAALEGPPVLDGFRSTLETSREPSGFRTREHRVRGWTTQRIDIHWQSPFYNKLDPADIQKMLDHPKLFDFALGLYFENQTDTENPSIQLKDAFKNIPLKEKGILGDVAMNVANKVARVRRNYRYKKAIERNPNALRIVSEGDSWFQHPLVTDTIDHLAATYPVYCVAAAGDTLRNMTMASEGNPPVEEYLVAIRKHKPAVFVLSGGGNDILGKQFRRYLKEGVVAGPNTKPADYLEPLLTADINALQAMYREIFTKLRADPASANLKVLVHGYDYIIPLQEEKKGWLGRYMIEKEIGGTATNPQGQQLRKAILRHILTEFNDRLKAVVAEFGDFVSYIETPGTVADNQWSDEIHPNSAGFALVAAKFKKRIAELIPSA